MIIILNDENHRWEQIPILKSESQEMQATLNSISDSNKHKRPEHPKKDDI